MKKEKTNNYYTNQDLINFEKLDNFKELKLNKLKNKQIKAHPFRYATSDDKHFNKIMNNNDNSTSENLEKKNNKSYYNSLDFKNFTKINQFTIFDKNKNTNKISDDFTKTINYSDDDINTFNKIIENKGTSENKMSKQINNKKIKIVDFNKLDKREKNLKNNIGIEKIKVVYFD